MFEDMKDWHNQFRKQVTIQTKEHIFRSISFQNNIISNASVRILVAIRILKETEGLSNQKKIECYYFNILMYNVLNLFDIKHPIPIELTCYLFSKRIQKYSTEHDINLYNYAIKRNKGRYQLKFLANGDFCVFDTITNDIIDSFNVICKNNTIKWIIKTKIDYRYFTQKYNYGYMLLKQVA